VPKSPQAILSGNLLAIGSGERKPMTNMIVYLVGTLLVVAGLAYGASRLGVSQVWIIAGALVIVGLGLMAGIVKTRQKDPAA
jgi:NADH:ubiquinone oxidoreductase subunit 6 (subunit J)